jgi:hypothetical protein
MEKSDRTHRHTARDRAPVKSYCEQMLDAQPINNQPSTMLFQFKKYYIPLSSIFDW